MEYKNKRNDRIISVYQLVYNYVIKGYYFKFYFDF